MAARQHALHARRDLRGDAGARWQARPQHRDSRAVRRAADREFVEHGFFEIEIGRRIERFGHVAQVRSVYETRRGAKAPLLGRGVNYLLLFWDGTRWWISSAVWDDERPGGKIPESWLGRRERVP